MYKIKLGGKITILHSTASGERDTYRSGSQNHQHSKLIHSELSTGLLSGNVTTPADSEIIGDIFQRHHQNLGLYISGPLLFELNSGRAVNHQV